MFSQVLWSAVLVTALTACSVYQRQPVIVSAVQEVISPAEPSINSFEDWRAQFYQKALKQGIDGQTLHQLLDHVQENPQIVALDRKQPEFAKMPWEYLSSAVSQTRIDSGRKKIHEQSALLQSLEAQTGVPAQIIAAIWGMETSYGAATGNSDLANSLATLAYEGRRRAFAEQQLMALARLLSTGDVPWQPLKGSWAGGMGHTQFIPETWLNYGVDANGDGIRNPWDKADALASTANYLARSGWKRNLPWGVEVQLPAQADANWIGEKHTFADWQRLGVSAISGTLPANAMAELWLPAGIHGPALLLSDNFRVIKVYNNSSNYALAVALLGEALKGKAGLQTPWPYHEQPLSTEQIRLLQQRLSAQGYDTKGTDGILGANTRKAFQAWQRANGQFADGFVSQNSASALLQ